MDVNLRSHSEIDIHRDLTTWLGTRIVTQATDTTSDGYQKRLPIISDTRFAEINFAWNPNALLFKDPLVYASS